MAQPALREDGGGGGGSSSSRTLPPATSTNYKNSRTLETREEEQWLEDRMRSGQLLDEVDGVGTVGDALARTAARQHAGGPSHSHKTRSPKAVPHDTSAASDVMTLVTALRTEVIHHEAAYGSCIRLTQEEVDSLMQRVATIHQELEVRKAEAASLDRDTQQAGHDTLQRLGSLVENTKIDFHVKRLQSNVKQLQDLLGFSMDPAPSGPSDHLPDGATQHGSTPLLRERVVGNSPVYYIDEDTSEGPASKAPAEGDAALPAPAPPEGASLQFIQALDDMSSSEEGEGGEAAASQPGHGFPAEGSRRNQGGKLASSQNPDAAASGSSGAAPGGVAEAGVAGAGGGAAAAQGGRNSSGALQKIAQSINPLRKKKKKKNSVFLSILQDAQGAAAAAASGLSGGADSGGRLTAEGGGRGAQPAPPGASPLMTAVRAIEEKKKRDERQPTPDSMPGGYSGDVFKAETNLADYLAQHNMELQDSDTESKPPTPPALEVSQVEDGAITSPFSVAPLVTGFGGGDAQQGKCPNCVVLERQLIQTKKKSIMINDKHRNLAEKVRKSSTTPLGGEVEGGTGGEGVKLKHLTTKCIELQTMNEQLQDKLAEVENALDERRSEVAKLRRRVAFHQQHAEALGRGAMEHHDGVLLIKSQIKQRLLVRRSKWDSVRRKIRRIVVLGRAGRIAMSVLHYIDCGQQVVASAVRALALSGGVSSRVAQGVPEREAMPLDVQCSTVFTYLLTSPPPSTYTAVSEMSKVEAQLLSITKKQEELVARRLRLLLQGACVGEEADARLSAMRGGINAQRYLVDEIVAELKAHVAGHMKGAQLRQSGGRAALPGDVGDEWDEEEDGRPFTSEADSTRALLDMEVVEDEENFDTELTMGAAAFTSSMTSIAGQREMGQSGGSSRGRTSTSSKRKRRRDNIDQLQGHVVELQSTLAAKQSEIRVLEMQLERRSTVGSVGTPPARERAPRKGRSVRPSVNPLDGTGAAVATAREDSPASAEQESHSGTDSHSGQALTLAAGGEDGSGSGTSAHDAAEAGRGQPCEVEGEGEGGRQSPGEPDGGDEGGERADAQQGKQGQQHPKRRRAKSRVADNTTKQQQQHHHAKPAGPAQRHHHHHHDDDDDPHHHQHHSHSHTRPPRHRQGSDGKQEHHHHHGDGDPQLLRHAPPPPPTELDTRAPRGKRAPSHAPATPDAAPLAAPAHGADRSERLAAECESLRKQVASLRGEARAKAELEKTVAELQRALATSRRAEGAALKSLRGADEEASGLRESLAHETRTRQQHAGAGTPTPQHDLTHEAELDAANTTITRLRRQLAAKPNFSAVLPRLAALRSASRRAAEAVSAFKDVLTGGTAVSEALASLKELLSDTGTPLGARLAMVNRMAWYEWRDAVIQEEPDEARAAARLDRHPWMRPRAVQDFLQGGSLWLEAEGGATLTRPEREQRRQWLQRNFYRATRFLEAYKEGWLAVRPGYAEGYSLNAPEGSQKRYARVSLPFQTAPLDVFAVHPSYVSREQQQAGQQQAPADPPAAPHQPPALQHNEGRGDGSSGTPPDGGGGDGKGEGEGEGGGGGDGAAPGCAVLPSLVTVPSYRKGAPAETYRNMARLVDAQQRLSAKMHKLAEQFDGEMAECETEAGRDAVAARAKREQASIQQQEEEILQQLLSFWTFEPEGLAKVNTLLGSALLRTQVSSQQPSPTRGAEYRARKRGLLSHVLGPEGSLYPTSDDFFDFSITTRRCFPPVPPPQLQAAPGPKRGAERHHDPAEAQLPEAEEGVKLPSLPPGPRREASVPNMSAVLKSQASVVVGDSRAVGRGNLRKGAAFARCVAKASPQQGADFAVMSGSKAL